MLNCKEASALMSQALDRRLSLWERANLRLHLLVCEGCRRFERQMALLRTACRRLFDEEAN
jgi:predicted anti-sigma-YlaC factor YlaD